MKRKMQPRWARLVECHRRASREGSSPWLSSISQVWWMGRTGQGTTTISKVRSEARQNGYRWDTRIGSDGYTEYRPVRVR